jgi:hypothetical protein
VNLPTRLRSATSSPPSAERTMSPARADGRGRHSPTRAHFQKKMRATTKRCPGRRLFGRLSCRESFVWVEGVPRVREIKWTLRQVISLALLIASLPRAASGSPSG